jgi:hypothetical protein
MMMMVPTTDDASLRLCEGESQRLLLSGGVLNFCRPDFTSKILFIQS